MYCGMRPWHRCRQLEEEIGSLELELKAVVSHLMRALGTELCPLEDQ